MLFRQQSIRKGHREVGRDTGNALLYNSGLMHIRAFHSTLACVQYICVCLGSICLASLSQTKEGSLPVNSFHKPNV